MTVASAGQQYLRVDGAAPPPDFVTGAAAADLAAMIQYLRADLGCP